MVLMSYSGVRVSVWSLAISLVTAAAALAQPVPRPPEVVSRDANGHATLRAVRITTPPQIDGKLDEQVYKDIQPAGDFIQQEPLEGRPATDTTEVWVLFDDKNVYVAARMFEQDSSKRVTSDMRRDASNMYNNDHIAVLFDTFNDRRRAFIFGVNPLGVQEDGVQTEGSFNAGRMFGMNGSVDLSPDYLFESKGVLTPQGYVVEIRIPFKSLRYPTTPGAKWGLNVLRKTQRTGREDTWTDARRVASFLAQSGAMAGIGDWITGVLEMTRPDSWASTVKETVPRPDRINAPARDDGRKKEEENCM